MRVQNKFSNRDRTCLRVFKLLHLEEEDSKFDETSTILLSNFSFGPLQEVVKVFLGAIFRLPVNRLVIPAIKDFSVFHIGK